ncbi:enolase C-terminal domain-like protein [Paludibacterium paludis]|uniref:Mandelate racemase/muconate lactonizing enzyme C-terminal domain-containing protein n=1 Tax=Paludibacterium paludis TaxID=1225769 RepID=A0A918UAC2_9NEIS|nr:enolase C-terminal domain-like protein [Paludibacterium paludis]GGY16480.1 hypothetical protein GCM10011289_19700 [Paludibacterium paludis]
MRITDIRELTIPLSRYADPALPGSGLTTSMVAVATDLRHGDRPVVGYGFASIGRYGQGGLIRERFAPRLIGAAPDTLLDAAGQRLDPARAWAVMMAGEKPGGHGERCVAVGALDMALWDAAAKAADLPLSVLLADYLERDPEPEVRVYAGGGYPYPLNDLERLADEMRIFADQGFTHAKIKTGAGLETDLRRIETAAAQLGGSERLAVDAMNRYTPQQALAAAGALAGHGLWWFEDVCDPLDFDTQSLIAATYPGPIAAGEALFSVAEAKLLDRHGGLRREHDILVFDPVHCYGLTGYLDIVGYLLDHGWPRRAFWPHGGHLFSLHLVAALGLGGAEINPLAFDPFRGVFPGIPVENGITRLPDAPGIGFELHGPVWSVFRALGLD